MATKANSLRFGRINKGLVRLDKAFFIRDRSDIFEIQANNLFIYDNLVDNNGIRSKTMLGQGQILRGRYSVVRRLGEGGMGAVYEATDGTFGTPVALKEVIFEASNEQQRAYLAAAFEREAKSLAKARHECIPFVRDYFSEDNREYLVMELVEGNDLAKVLLDNGKPFLIAETVDWLRQLLDALDYIHNLDPAIIHRDIKPQNIKITGRRRLKLLDFGIAKSGDTSANTTHKQTFIGATLNYSPIEQILRVIDVTFRDFIILKHEARANEVLAQMTDARADIFSVGATFYHLLTNVVPVESTKRTLAVWEGDPDPLVHPSDINPELPREWGDFLVKAMSIDRDERYSSAAEMLDRMGQVAGPSMIPVNSAQSIHVSEPGIDVPPPAIEPESDSIRTIRMSESSPSVQTDPPRPETAPEPVSVATKLVVKPDDTDDEVETAGRVTPIQAPIAVPPQGRSSGVSKYWPILAAGGLLLFLLAGIAVWGGFYGSGGTASNVTTTATAVSGNANTSPSPMVTPQAASSPAATQSATPALAPSPTATPIGESGSPASNTIVRPVSPAGQGKKQGPHPAPAKPKDLGCAYTNSC